MTTKPDVINWVPEAIYAQDAGLKVKWRYIGGERFVHPFFDQTLRHCRLHLNPPQAPLETAFDFLRAASSKHPGLLPSAFIFHMSRCGSTLLSQIFASLSKNIVISEAPAIDAILRIQPEGRPVSDGQRIGWLQSVVNAICQKRDPVQKYVVIKWDSWHTLQIPLIMAAFPQTPWIFLYRNPVEVMASHMRMRGMHLVPGLLAEDLFGFGAAPLERMSLDEYGVRVLAAICDAAVQYHRHGRGILLNYSQLSAKLLPQLFTFWGMTFSDAQYAQMCERMLFDAKRPLFRFENDAGSKTNPVTPEVLELVRQRLDPVYAQLESIRFKQNRVFCGKH